MRPGETIAQRYEIVRPARGGASGMVFEAFDRRTAKKVAVKLISLQREDPALMSRVEREIKILTGLSHPHIVACHGSGTLPDGKVYLVLEWLTGQDLADFKARAPMSLRNGLELIAQVAGALETAHQKGIIHRDVKPANIFLVAPEIGAAPNARVLDFGVAKADDATGLTAIGAVLGTPSYMAPEQATQAMAVDGRADVFSLGVVAFELITGKLPWESKSDLARLARILVERAYRVHQVSPEVPDPVADLVDSMLEHSPEDRPQSMSAVAEAANAALRAVPGPLLDTVYNVDPQVLGNFVRQDTASLPLPPRASRSRPPAAPSRSLGDMAVDDSGEHLLTLVPPVNEVKRRVPPPEEATRVLPSDRMNKPPSAKLRLPPAEPSAGLRAEARRRRTMVPVPREDSPAEAPSLHDLDPRSIRPPSAMPVESPESSEEETGAAMSPAIPTDPATAAPLVETLPPTIPPQRLPLHDLPPTAPMRPAIRETSEVEVPTRRRSKLDDQLSYVEDTTGFTLFGRTQVLDHLRAAALAPLTTKTPGWTLVLGPAGIGKTRIRTELARMLRAAPGGPVVFSGRADEVARATPYAFLRRMLLAEARIFADDPAEVKQGKLGTLLPAARVVSRYLKDHPVRHGAAQERTRFSQVGAWTERPSMVAAMSDAFEAPDPERGESEADRAMVLGYLCEALEIEPPEPPSPERRRDPRVIGAETRRALDLVIADLARSRGVVVLVDDAHLLDRQSALVLRDQVADGGEGRISVIAFGLPALAEAGPSASPLLGKSASIIEVPPLDARASRDMIKKLVDGPIRADALETLVQRGAGNPLYLEQLVRSVRESGVLAKNADGEHALVGLKGDQSDVDRVPPTVAAAVRARIERSKPELQRTLSCAAVFGEVFWAEGVAKVLGEDVDDTLVRLDQLLLADLVRRRPSSRYPGTTELELSHAVVRSVVLSKVKQRRRRELERAVADFLASVGEVDPATLAYHRAHAGMAAEAATLYADAAERGLASGAVFAAGALAEEGQRAVAASEVEVDAAVKARLLDISSRVKELEGDLDGADEAIGALVEMPSDRRREAELLDRRSRLALKRNRLREACEYAETARILWADAGDPLGEATARLSVAEISEIMADSRSALRGYIGAQSVFESKGAREGLARTTLGFARIALYSGDYRNAESRYREALVHARSVRVAGATFESFVGLAVVARRMGDPDRAKEFLDEAAGTAADPAEEQLLAVQRALLQAERGEVGLAFSTLSGMVKDEAGVSAALRRIALLFSAQLFVGFKTAPERDRRTVASLIDRLESALEAAGDQAPVLSLPLESALATMLAEAGQIDRAAQLAEHAAARFSREGALAEDEPPRLLLAHAHTLEKIGAATRDVAEALRSAVEQLDLVSSRLDRKMRDRYLARPLARAVIGAAEKAGFEVARDKESNRLALRPKER